jgi:hypothetical protein
MEIALNPNTYRAKDGGNKPDGVETQKLSSPCNILHQEVK